MQGVPPTYPLTTNKNVPTWRQNFIIDLVLMLTQTIMVWNVGKLR